MFDIVGARVAFQISVDVVLILYDALVGHWWVGRSRGDASFFENEAHIHR